MPWPETQGSLKVNLSVVVVLIGLAVGGTWTLQETRQATQAEQSECISSIEREVTSNTRRIDSLEQAIEPLKQLPTQISGMSADIRYLRQSVEVLMSEWRKEARSR